VEDQGGAPTLAEIRKRFGDTVADIVAGCSDTDVNPKPPWRTRKEAYIAHVYTTTPSVRLVSAADKLHNIRSILSDYYQEGDKTWEKFKGGKEGSLWYYRELVKAFKATTGNTPLIQELDRHVTLLENLVAASNNKAS
jgi:(p)ppGpp synthase/HD superfamily hydrolase